MTNYQRSGPKLERWQQSSIRDGNMRIQNFALTYRAPILMRVCSSLIVVQC